MSPNVKLDDGFAKLGLYAFLFVKALISQRYIIKGNGAGEIILGQIGTVIGERRVAAVLDLGATVADTP